MMAELKERKRAWGLILIAVWLLLNGVELLVSQVLRLSGIQTYSFVAHDAGYAALDTGVVVMDIVVASPVYILAGILLWRRHLWGLILSVASVIELTYVIGMFAVAFTQLNLWRQVPVEDIAFMLLALLINVAALAYLAYRYARAHLGNI